jgi:aspartate dehydrogenase
MPVRRVGLIGCGTIGGQLALALDAGEVPNASLVAIFDTVSENARSLASKLQTPPLQLNHAGKFLESDIDIVVEAASQQAVKAFAIPVLEAGKDLMIMSVGALAESDFLADLLRTAQKRNCKIYLPTGAIAGVDAIRSVRGLIQQITLTTTKNPKALSGAPFFESKGIKVESITKRTEIYSGPASEAVKLFPANVNVAAVVSLAGIGPSKTQVKIVADPEATTNRHAIVATGSFGEIEITVNNVPSPGNPKTSYLAVLSAIECLRSVSDDLLRIGS